MKEHLTEYCSADLQDLRMTPEFSSSPESSERKPIYKTLSAPLEVQLELTTGCNRSCVHCYNYWRNGENSLRSQTLSDEQITGVLDNLGKHGIFHLTITGGEPLLFKEKTFRLIKEATSRGIDCSLNSNLYSVTPEDAQRLQEAGVSFVLTSLPSADPQTHDLITQHPGSFRETLQGIETLLKSGVPVGANMVISKSNQNQIYETGRFLKEVGVNYFYATKASPPLTSHNFEAIRVDRAAIKESLAILTSLSGEFGMITDILECYPLCLIGDVEKFAKFAQHSCRGGITSTTISANGDLRPCSHSDQVYGNIFQSFDRAWLNMGEWRDGSLIPKTCLSCTHFQRCSGGCRMEAKYDGAINGMDPFATGPEGVILPNKMNRRQEIDFQQSLAGRLSIVSNLRKRKEGFGGILKGNGDYVLVNEALWGLIDNLQMKDFTTEDIRSNYGFTESEVLVIFSFLQQQGVIRQTEKGGETVEPRNS